MRSEWPGTVYPCVPGHEIVGRVTAVGPEVTRLQGRAIWSRSAAWSIPAGRCRACREGLEQYCEGGFTGTYNSPDR